MKSLIFQTTIFIIVILFSFDVQGQEENELFGRWNELNGTGYIEFQDDYYGSFDDVGDLCLYWQRNFKYKIEGSRIFVEPLEELPVCNRIYILKYIIKDDFLTLYKYDEDEKKYIEFESKFMKSL